MSINLQRFCANSAADSRDYLYSPWRSGQWVYATNGHVIVRVPAKSAPEVAERDEGKLPKAAALFGKWMDDRAGLEYLRVPPMAALNVCGGCDGAGVVRSIKCPDCEEGEFTHGRHVYQCQECEDRPAGPGRITVGAGFETPEVQQTPCDHCVGRGATDRQNTPVKLGDAHYSAVYLHWLAALPQVRVCPGDKSDANPCAPACFIFDGGQALLMPYRAE